MTHPSEIYIKDFTYDLPEDRIAKFPLANRDESKLLVYKQDQISESVFGNITSFIEESSVLVFNESKVIQARLNFKNEKDQEIEIFCLEPYADVDISTALVAKGLSSWNCLVGNLKRWKNGALFLKKENIELVAKIQEKKTGFVVVSFSWQPVHFTFAEILEVFGEMPIPPYLNRKSDLSDSNRYQTIYSRQQGSVAAPTAGLHFTPEVFEKLKAASVTSLSVTLHVGAGTFKPVKSETMAGHEMHAEWIDVTANTILKLIEQADHRIIAVGTTSLRTLESLYWMGMKISIDKNISLKDLEIKQWEVYEWHSGFLGPKESLSLLIDWMNQNNLQRLVCQTQILIATPYELQIAKGIITNFHQPNSTLLLLVAAIVGNKWKDIYSYALDHNFRFLSYGDSSLILK